MYKVNTDDIRKWVESYKGERFHALLSDPPYNLESIKKRFGNPSAKPAQYGKDGAFSRVSKGFMGKEWDTDVAFNPVLWEGIKEILYPGAFGLAFMGARTYHRLAIALEDAGFIIHPMMGWIQSQGLPKGTRIDTQIDKALGREREVIGKIKNPGSTKPRISMHNGWQDEPVVTKSASRLAEVWEGYRYGLMALKPCMEPILMFQKPYDGKPFRNIIRTGAGALNIAGTEFSTGREFIVNTFDDGAKPFGNAIGQEYTSRTKDKLYPTTIIIDEFVGEPFNNFFYQSKAMKGEKESGLDDLPIDPDTGKRNNHPTVKPIQLNKYLATLLLPPKFYSPRRLLVPFSGTGSEIIGALFAGWDYVEGIELEQASVDISERRIKYWLENEKR